MIGPQKSSMQDILVNSLGSLIAGVIGSIVIVVVTFALSSIIDIPGTITNASEVKGTVGSIFPLVFSIITLIGTTITLLLTYKMLNITQPERYKTSSIIVGQIAFFSIFVYLFITPVYILIGMNQPDYIMPIFLFHILVLIFGTNIILELLNNYRYILIGIYASFAGLFISIILVIFVYSTVSDGYAKLISLVIILPIVNFLISFFKQSFQSLYYYYNSLTNQDQLGDIFYQMEADEKEKLRLEEEKNSI